MYRLGKNNYLKWFHFYLWPIFILSKCHPTYQKEVEPNDTLRTAQTLDSPVTLKGHYYKPEGIDRDCFRFDLSEPKMFRFKVSGVKGVDVKMYVYFGDEAKPQKIIDDNLTSLGESLAPIYIDKNEVFFCLEPHNAANQEEYQKFFYELNASLFQPLAGVEKEPNDYPEEANEISEESVVGYYNHGVLIRQESQEVLERDIYVLRLNEEKKYLINFELTPVAFVDPAVKIYHGGEQIRLVDEKGASQGEYLSHFGFQGPGELYFSIYAKDRKMNFSDYYQFKVNFEEYEEHFEFEPNDSLEKASRLGKDLFSGSLADKGDVDFVSLKNDNPYALEYQILLENKSQVNLVLESYTMEGKKLNSYNDSPDGASEAISNLFLPSGESVILKVFSLSPKKELYPANYVFRLQSQPPMDFYEREPNNRMQEANPISLGTSLVGYINPNQDQDVFVIRNQERFRVKVLIDGIEGCKMLLRVGDKTGAIYESRESRREGEGISLTFDCEKESYFFLYCNRASRNLYGSPYKLSLEVP